MLKNEGIISELIFKAVKSSGSGGQHVNKVSTKVELLFNIENSQFLNITQKKRLQEVLGNRINKNGFLVMSCSETRSQFQNKTIVTERFLHLIGESLTEQKKRKSTKIPKAVKQKRLTSKRKQSEKKAQRKPPNLE